MSYLSTTMASIYPISLGYRVLLPHEQSSSFQAPKLHRGPLKHLFPSPSKSKQPSSLPKTSHTRPFQAKKPSQSHTTCPTPQISRSKTRTQPTYTSMPNPHPPQLGSHPPRSTRPLHTSSSASFLHDSKNFHMDAKSEFETDSMAESSRGLLLGLGRWTVERKIRGLMGSRHTGAKGGGSRKGWRVLKWEDDEGLGLRAGVGGK